MSGDLPGVVTFTLLGAGYFGISTNPLELVLRGELRNSLVFQILLLGSVSQDGGRARPRASCAPPPRWAPPQAPPAAHDARLSRAGWNEHAPCSAPCVSRTIRPAVWLVPSLASGDSVSHISLCLGALPRVPRAPSASCVLHAEGSSLPASRLHLSNSRSWPSGPP